MRSQAERDRGVRPPIAGIGQAYLQHLSGFRQGRLTAPQRQSVWSQHKWDAVQSVIMLD
jgi:hypothetical protein